MAVREQTNNYIPLLETPFSNSIQSRLHTAEIRDTSLVNRVVTVVRDTVGREI